MVPAFRVHLRHRNLNGFKATNNEGEHHAENTYTQILHPVRALRSSYGCFV
jgi:hypothetical protein